jgi:hypothetical protein
MTSDGTACGVLGAGHWWQSGEHTGIERGEKGCQARLVDRDPARRFSSTIRR